MRLSGRAAFNYERRLIYEVAEEAAYQSMSKKSSSRPKRSAKRTLKRGGAGVISDVDLSALASTIREAQLQFAVTAREELGKASRELASFPVEIQTKLLALMQTGWGIDPDQPILFVRLAQGEFGNGRAADAWIAGHFESRLDEIETALARSHPERAAILSDAFDAHRRGLYTLSVPVLLAQADGIVGDRYKKKQLFSKSNNNGLASQINGMEPGQLATMWAETVSGNAEVSSNVRDLPVGFIGLNRHSVLHGVDLEYGTKENSIKAVSLLYMASHLVATNAEPIPID